MVQSRELSGQPNHMVAKSWVNMPQLSSGTSHVSTFKETRVWITIYESIINRLQKFIDRYLG